jgi:hypothetical protein
LQIWGAENQTHWELCFFGYLQIWGAENHLHRELCFFCIYADLGSGKPKLFFFCLLAFFCIFADLESRKPFSYGALFFWIYADLGSREPKLCFFCILAELGSRKLSSKGALFLFDICKSGEQKIILI